MLSVLNHRTYARLFAAQVLSLIGTGLTTVALGLLAYDLAGADAGLVLGTALALKMVAYVGLAPVAGALAGRVPRRRFLVTLDLVRAAMVLFLPFVTQLWQIYLLVFLFQSCSAAFTPTFQATIPDVLPEEKDYTRALSLSRLAYDLESLVSPLLAGALLTLASFGWLFVGNAVGFLASAALVASVALPRGGDAGGRGFRERLTRGAWIYLATPRLRGLLALNVAVAAAGAMVIVNTVVLVREALGGSDRDVAILLVAYGAGSMAAALLLPRLLGRIEPRPAMLAGAGLLAVALAAAALGPGYGEALVLWIVLGAGASLVQTPSGLLLRRSSNAGTVRLFSPPSSRCRMPAGSLPILPPAGSGRGSASAPPFFSWPSPRRSVPWPPHGCGRPAIRRSCRTSMTRSSTRTGRPKTRITGRTLSHGVIRARGATGTGRCDIRTGSSSTTIIRPGRNDAGFEGVRARAVIRTGHLRDRRAFASGVLRIDEAE